MTAPNRFVIFVDDDEDDRFIMQECCKELSLSARTHFLSSGEELLRFLSSRTHSSDLPSLIVLDFNMPAMDGAEILLRLRRDKRFSNIPVVFFSTSSHNLEHYLTEGLDAVHQKPSGYAEIRKKISSFFEPLPARDEAPNYCSSFSTSEMSISTR